MRLCMSRTHTNSRRFIDVKYLIVILTISSILAKDLYQFTWDIWFRINQDTIAQVHCENKDKPVLKCDGKCYLAKQLKKAEVSIEREQEQPDAPVRPKVQADAKIEHFARFTCEFESISYEEHIASLRIAFQEASWDYIPVTGIDHPPTV